ncbi:TPA: hypothetical protein I7291_06085 [Vibrio parahaemolyticus]|nr:hypothetical protein [Vibrio parahaemolyticus]HAS6914855.1 hypothetical protein [Vibrio parahaemolyticus]HAS6925329.1 hypothetical protein [Vibrio parahaemolyticus]
MTIPASLKRSVYFYIAIDLFKVFVILAVAAFFCYGIWDSFEIAPEKYEEFASYIEHDFCGQLAIDYASDGRVTIYELVETQQCVEQDEKRKLYSKLEAK